MVDIDLFNIDLATGKSQSNQAKAEQVRCQIIKMIVITVFFINQLWGGVFTMSMTPHHNLFTLHDRV